METAAAAGYANLGNKGTILDVHRCTVCLYDVLLGKNNARHSSSCFASGGMVEG